MKTTVTTKTTTEVKVNNEPKETQTLDDKVAPKGKGKLDMIIAFDTTGSMAAYIDDVRQQVAEMIPRIFKDNEDLRLGIVAFGDYHDQRYLRPLQKQRQDRRDDRDRNHSPKRYGVCQICPQLRN